MSLSMLRASTPVFVRALNVLSDLLDKAEAHTVANDLAPQELIEARLAPDMMPLSAQIQRASDASKLCVSRLTGVAAPPMPDTETTFPELKDRVAKTIAWLESVPATAFDGSETREIVLKAGTFEQTFRGEDYLLGFAIPNFFFHVTTAYGILRMKGVTLGKGDFLGLGR